MHAQLNRPTNERQAYREKQTNTQTQTDTQTSEREDRRTDGQVGLIGESTKGRRKDRQTET